MASINRWQTVVADALSIAVGTPTGGISDIQHWKDGNQLAIQEVAATPGLTLTVTFENVTSILFLAWVGFYDGSATHCIDVELWNYVTSAWDIMDSLPDSICTISHTVPILEDSDYINSDGQVQMRMNHAMGGNTSHDLYLSYVGLLY